MMFQRQLITSIENIQRKNGEMSLSFLEQKSKKDTKRKSAKNTSKKQKTGKGERASFCDLTRARARVFLFCVSRFFARS